MSRGIYTPTLAILHDGPIVHLGLSASIPLLADRQYDPLRALVRGIVTPHLHSGDAVILGSLFVDFIEFDVPELGWREGEHYLPTRLEIWSEFSLGEQPIQPWFFPRMPANCRNLDLDQAFVNDALCVLTSYTGPTNLDLLLNGLGPEAKRDEILARLLQHCDSVITVDDDGMGLNIFSLAKETPHEVPAVSAGEST
jgi:hypothetical protein